MWCVGKLLVLCDPMNIIRLVLVVTDAAFADAAC
ncbi:hypothetical protein CFELI_05560 [Corynebacterium felinum]|uniref:Uncharacterized protein n=1 Tax=Corynebacterium felinum TaxID=131318 RepID=A0ABU2B9W8_9CORY|nr:hypothetical protein [Corynebacterium felinum]WJY94740.1 hypothetical protein CFELI_05560 [Corynebacterium felinum]